MNVPLCEWGTPKLGEAEETAPVTDSELTSPWMVTRSWKLCEVAAATWGPLCHQGWRTDPNNPARGVTCQPTGLSLCSIWSPSWEGVFTAAMR